MESIKVWINQTIKNQKQFHKQKELSLLLIREEQYQCRTAEKKLKELVAFDQLEKEKAI